MHRVLNQHFQTLNNGVTFWQLCAHCHQQELLLGYNFHFFFFFFKKQHPPHTPVHAATCMYTHKHTHTHTHTHTDRCSIPPKKVGSHSLTAKIEDSTADSWAPPVITLSCTLIAYKGRHAWGDWKVMSKKVWEREKNCRHCSKQARQGNQTVISACPNHYIHPPLHSACKAALSVSKPTQNEKPSKKWVISGCFCHPWIKMHG